MKVKQLAVAGDGRMKERVKTAAKCAAILGIMMGAQAAFAGYSIGSGGGGTFALLRTWFQDFVDFMDGPFGIAAVVISLVLAFATWAFAPKEGIVGPVLRIAMSGIVILNVATWMGSFGAATP